MVALRGGNGNGNGNEAKNERLRVRWLGSAVTELQGEVAQVLRTRNASEELAERSRMKSELALLKGDVAAVGRGIRNLGGRIAKIDAILGTIRLDIASVKESFSLVSRTCADIGSQVRYPRPPPFKSLPNRRHALLSPRSCISFSFLFTDILLVRYSTCPYLLYRTSASISTSPRLSNLACPSPLLAPLPLLSVLPLSPLALAFAYS